MNASQKSTTDSPKDSQTSKGAENPQFSFPMPSAIMFQQGLERFADLQKSTLDLYVRQAEDAVKSLKQSSLLAPGTLLADVAGQNIDRFIEMQKSAVDLMVRQSAVGVDAVKQHASSASKAAGAMTELIRETAEMSVATHNLALEFAARQNKIVADAVKQQPGVSGTPAAAAADAIKRSVDAALETQKQLLNIAVKPLETQKAEA